jgi:steroid delta-isomerase-like uncharacterized protein
MAIEENKARVRRAVDHFNRGDLEAYLEVYAADAVLHDFGIEPGVDNIRRFYQGFMAAFPDVQITTEDLIGEGDQVAERITLRGTHRGDFQGVPPTGKPITMSGITILRFQDGRCVERWTQGDFLGLLQQLGAIPAPEPA